MVKAQKLAFFLSVVLLLAIMLAGIIFTCMPNVSAEETTDKYVVFNQHVENGNFANGTTGYLFSNLTGSVSNGVYTCKPTTIPSVSYGSSINLSIKYFANHKYYLRFTCSSTYANSFCTFTNNNGVDFFKPISTTMTTYSNISTCTKSGILNTYIYATFANFSRTDTFSISNINLIDLTQMFGVGNEPNISTCDALFASDYYPYNVDGSVISLDGFSNYSQGVLDTNKSYSTTLTYSMLSRNAFLYDNLGADELDRIDYTSDNKLVCWGVVGLPLNSVVRAGNTITVACSPSELLIGNDIVGTQVNIAYLYNNTLVPIAVLIGGNGEDYDRWAILSGNVTFSCPYDIDTLFIFCSNYNSTTPTVDKLAYIADLRVSFSSFDNSILLNQSWNSGFDSGYKSGYNKGYNNGLVVGADKQYSFAGLLDAVVQAPISALIGSYDSSGKRVGGLLNFNFLGVNLSFFFTGLLSVTIVILIIRFILARK